MRLRRRISARIDVQFVRREIQQPFHHEHAVLAAGAAIGRDDRQVGEHLRERAVVVRHHIGAEQGALAVDRHRQPVGIVGAAIVQEHVLDAENAAVAAERDFGVVDLAAFMGGGEEMLQPVLDPFDRPVQLHRRPGQQHFLGVEHHDLRPETAADEGRDDADLAFVEAKHAGKAVADEYRRLRGVPDRHLAGARVPLRDHAAGLDRRRDAVLVEEAAFDDAIGLGGGGGIIALGLPHMRGDVGADVVVHQRRAALQAFFEIDHCGKLLELDVDIVECVLGEIAALGDHDRQRLADMADLVLGERHLGALRGTRCLRSGAAAPAAGRAASSRRGRRRHRRRRRRGAASARDTSMLMILACATWLRSNAACSMPGSSTSSTNSACPVRSLRSSLRLTGSPNVRVDMPVSPASVRRRS